jgi:hypothetical protein
VAVSFIDGENLSQVTDKLDQTNIDGSHLGKIIDQKQAISNAHNF